MNTGAILEKANCMLKIIILELVYFKLVERDKQYQRD